MQHKDCNFFYIDKNKGKDIVYAEDTPLTEFEQAEQNAEYSMFNVSNMHRNSGKGPISKKDQVKRIQEAIDALIKLKELY